MNEHKNKKIERIESVSIDDQLQTVLHFIKDITSIIREIEREQLMKIRSKSFSRQSSAQKIKRDFYIDANLHEKILIEENIAPVEEESLNTKKMLIE